MPTIIDHAGAQTKANPNSPSHSPAPTLTAQAMHGDDEHNPALHSTFDPALFDQLVYACVKRVPRGCVTTYGHIARLCHHPKHARQVGQALRRLPLNTRVPWQRIINASYAISSRGDGGAGAQQQASRLEEEEVLLTQDVMGVWKVSRAAEWDTGGAQSLADLVQAGVEEEEEEEQGDEREEEQGDAGGQGEEKKKKKKKKKKSNKNKEKRKREKEEVVAKEEEEGVEEGVQ